MNQWNGTGRAVRDAELRRTQGGKTVTRFTVAVRGFGDQTDYVAVTCWDRLAEAVGANLCKGMMAGVTGELHSRKYTGSDGVERTAWEISASRVDFLSWPKDSDAKGSGHAPADLDWLRGDSGFDDIDGMDVPF